MPLVRDLSVRRAVRLALGVMSTLDESVLAFIGPAGQTLSAIADRFPGFDVMRLVRAQLVDIVFEEPDTVGHVADLVVGEMLCVLTHRGRAATGMQLTD